MLLYLETVNDPDKLAEAAAIACARDLPLLVLKSGRTQSGQRAASSHTGAMATEDRVVDAFLRHHAIWRASDPHDLVNAAELYLKGWRPQGRKLVAVSNSGATCVMAADMAEEFHLPLAVLADGTRGQLNAILPGFATTTNPIDITGALLTDSSLFGKILEIVGKDAGADLFFAGIPIAGTGYDVEAFARDAANFITTTGKPLALAVPQDAVAAPFIKLGVPVFASDRQALQALHQLAAHTTLMRRRRKASAAAPVQISSDSGRQGLSQRSRQPGPARGERHSGGAAAPVPQRSRGARGVARTGRAGGGESLFRRGAAQIGVRPGGIEPQERGRGQRRIRCAMAQARGHESRPRRHHRRRHGQRPTRTGAGRAHRRALRAGGDGGRRRQVRGGSEGLRPADPAISTPTK